jgi:HK97 family phage major capsid protein
MTDQVPIPEVKAPEVKIDYDRIISGVAEALKAEAPSTKRAEPLSAAVQLKIPKYSKDPETDAFLHYIKTGRDAGVYKAALQEGTASEGGYLVPDDFYAKIIAKRDESSIVRQAGCLTINTSLDVVNVPVESTISSFSETAEEGAYSESEPELAQVSITVHKATNLIKISEELMADQAANLDGFLSEQLGRAQAAYENARFLTGNGTTQPQGVYVGGTAALTSDYATTIGASEIPELFSKLTEPYVPEAVWVMRWATYWNQINSLTGNPFQFMPTPAGGGWQYQLLGKRVLFSDQNAAFASVQKSIMVGNFRYYAVVERQGMRIQRNPYLYMANGQVGLFSSFRQGGAVLQAEAFQYLTNNS